MPQSVNVTEKRHFIRHPMCFPLKYKVIKKRSTRDIVEESFTTINVSRGGLLFYAKHPLEVDALILIRMPFRNRVFKVTAKVVRCDKNIETNLYSVGVYFQKFSEAFRVRLIEQMYLISEYRDLRAIQLGREVTFAEASREWIKRYSKRFQKLYW